MEFLGALGTAATYLDALRALGGGGSGQTATQRATGTGMSQAPMQTGAPQVPTMATLPQGGFTFGGGPGSTPGVPAAPNLAAILGANPQVGQMGGLPQGGLGAFATGATGQPGGGWEGSLRHQLLATSLAGGAPGAMLGGGPTPQQAAQQQPQWYAPPGPGSSGIPNPRAALPPPPGTQGVSAGQGGATAGMNAAGGGNIPQLPTGADIKPVLGVPYAPGTQTQMRPPQNVFGSIPGLIINANRMEANAKQQRVANMVARWETMMQNPDPKVQAMAQAEMNDPKNARLLKKVHDPNSPEYLGVQQAYQQSIQEKQQTVMQQAAMVHQIAMNKAAAEAATRAPRYDPVTQQPLGDMTDDQYRTWIGSVWRQKTANEGRMSVETMKYAIAAGDIKRYMPDGHGGFTMLNRAGQYMGPAPNSVDKAFLEKDTQQFVPDGQGGYLVVEKATQLRPAGGQQPGQQQPSQGAQATPGQQTPQQTAPQGQQTPPQPSVTQGGGAAGGGPLPAVGGTAGAGAAPSAVEQAITARANSTNVWQAFPDMNRLADAVIQAEGPGGLAAKNNNPGNLKDSSGRFIKFGSPEQGRQALIERLQQWQKQNPNMTLADFNRKYAPDKSSGGDNPNGTEARRSAQMLAGLGAPAQVSPAAFTPPAQPQTGSVRDPNAPINFEGAAGTWTPTPAGGVTGGRVVGRIMTSQPIVAYDPKTGLRRVSTAAEADKNGWTAQGKITVAQMEKAATAQRQFNDVQANISRYKAAATRFALEGKATDGAEMQTILNQSKLGGQIRIGPLGEIDIPGISSFTEAVDSAARATAEANLSPAGQQLLLSYIGALGAVPAYQKAITGVGRFNRETMELELRNIPSPLYPPADIQMYLSAFQQRAIDQGAEGIINVGGVPTLQETRDKFERPDIPQRLQQELNRWRPGAFGASPTPQSLPQQQQPSAAPPPPAAGGGDFWGQFPEHAQ